MSGHRPGENRGRVPPSMARIGAIESELEQVEEKIGATQKSTQRPPLEPTVFIKPTQVEQSPLKAFNSDTLQTRS
ncbi:hypothetical protein NDU88_002234 [Pleurodeles waltl]|uniref:Uncharacterized protein n=1 Tax=Pleurodeles waltl TaxID=8319 RepID=A0AAV7LBW1_PLEWA|nr:hypothetical protein NDU88_002234 [Pleurodeles waltl]